MANDELEKALIEAQKRNTENITTKHLKPKTTIILFLCILIVVPLLYYFYFNYSEKNKKSKWQPPTNQYELKIKFINTLTTGSYKNAGLKDAKYEGEKLTVYWDKIYWDQIPYKYKEETVQTIGGAWLKISGPDGSTYFKCYHSNKRLASCFSFGFDIEK